MKTHNIPLETLTPKKPVKVKIENGEIHIPAEETMLGKIRHHVNVPGKYKLPFRIDVTVRSKFIPANQIASQLTLYIGRGQVYFNGGYTSAADVLTAGDIAPRAVCHNDIPSGEFVTLSVTFGSEMMWTAVNNMVCFSSDNAEYIKLMRNNAITDGVAIAICGGTDTKLTITSLTVVEYESGEPDMPNEIRNLPELSAFELYIQGLPAEVREEVFKTDEYLLKDMKSGLKFRRKIDKHGHLTYTSSCGFQYEIREFGVGEVFETEWVQSAKNPDYTNEVLNKISESSSEFAEKIFKKSKECNPHTRECKRRTTIELNGKSRDVCMSKIFFKMTPYEFEDLRKFAAAVCEYMKTEVRK